MLQVFYEAREAGAGGPHGAARVGEQARASSGRGAGQAAGRGRVGAPGQQPRASKHGRPSTSHADISLIENKPFIRSQNGL